jgi:hypothetical protein
LLGAVYVGACTAYCLQSLLVVTALGAPMSVRSLITTLLALCAFLAAPAIAYAQDSADASPSASYVGGVTLVSVGGLAASGGLVTYFALSAATDTCEGATAGCSDPYKDAKTVSIVTMVLGGAGLAAGIPLLLTAEDSPFAKNKKKRRRRRTASLKPTVRVGAASASATWKF